MGINISSFVEIIENKFGSCGRRAPSLLHVRGPNIRIVFTVAVGDAELTSAVVIGLAWAVAGGDGH